MWDLRFLWGNSEEYYLLGCDPYSLIEVYLHLQEHTASMPTWLYYYLTLKIEAVHSSKT
jgi:hypothetical protein